MAHWHTLAPHHTHTNTHETAGTHARAHTHMHTHTQSLSLSSTGVPSENLHIPADSDFFRALSHRSANLLYSLTHTHTHTHTQMHTVHTALLLAAAAVTVAMGTSAYYRPTLVSQDLR